MAKESVLNLDDTKFTQLIIGITLIYLDGYTISVIRLITGSNPVLKAKGLGLKVSRLNQLSRPQGGRIKAITRSDKRRECPETSYVSFFINQSFSGFLFGRDFINVLWYSDVSASGRVIDE